METGPRFKVSYEKSVKWGIDLAIPELIVQRVIHYTTTAPPLPNKSEFRKSLNIFACFIFTDETLKVFYFIIYCC